MISGKENAPGTIDTGVNSFFYHSNNTVISYAH